MPFGMQHFDDHCCSKEQKFFQTLEDSNAAASTVDTH